MLIGLAAVLLLWLNGRIAGISGIAGGLWFAARGERAWRMSFLVGLVGRHDAVGAAGADVAAAAQRLSGVAAAAGRIAGRLWHRDVRRLHQWPWGVRAGVAVSALAGGHGGVSADGHRHHLCGAPSVAGGLSMDAVSNPPRPGQALVGLLAGTVFGLGLGVSQMVDPRKVLGFLDVAGAWDPEPDVRAGRRRGHGGAGLSLGVAPACAAARRPLPPEPRTWPSMRRWWPVRRCSASAGGWPATAPDRRSHPSASATPRRCGSCLRCWPGAGLQRWQLRRRRAQGASRQR